MDGPLGAGELATAVVGAGAGVAALADEEDDVSGDEESGDDFFDPVSTVDTSSGGGAAPGAFALRTLTPRRWLNAAIST